VRQRLSITGTLVVWFTAAGLVIIGAVSLFLFRAFDQYQQREQRRTLVYRVHDIVEDLQRAEDHDVLEEIAKIRALVTAENANRPRARFSVVIRDGHRVLLDVRPPAEAHEGQHVLTGTAVVDRGSHHYTIDLALDQTQTLDDLDDFRGNMLLALIAGATLVAIAGAVGARRAMRPLHRITAATRSLDVGRLDTSLDATDWPAELRALATAFGQMQVRLRESFDRLTQFSDDIAHELRTPLSNLIGSADVALARERPPDEYRDTIASMLEEGWRLQRMVDELLFLARADHPEGQLERTDLDAGEEAAAVADFFSALAAEKHVLLTVEGSARVFANRSLLRRALGNLLPNAVRHTPAGGSVRVVVSEDGGGTRIEVRDSGIGIDGRHLPHLFDRFYRIDESRSTEGTGLGLAIVKSIAALHGGTVTVVSEPGRGSVFTLHFPKMTDL
jgi:two-component system heavy metal sensor histidine kinase CusS